MNLIAAVDENWAIGNKGGLLVRIPGDQKMFREKTMGKTVVYGRKTLETFPHALPLSGRENIVLSSDSGYSVPGAVVVHSMDELEKELRDRTSEDIFVIGGASVYRQMLSRCDTAYITKIGRSYEADAYFPNLDLNPDWDEAETGCVQTYEGTPYVFVRYERKTVEK